MKPMGGTQLAHARLMEVLPDWAKEKAQIIAREEDIDHSKLQVFWTQDMPNSPRFLSDERARSGFDGIVFVSYWQQTVFALNAGVPFSAGTVIKNAVDPIPVTEKPSDIIRMIYQSVPDRGLEILVPVFDELTKEYDNIELDVYSNFDLYAQTHRNENYEQLFEACRNHEKINYFGTRPNSEVRDAVSKAHIFAYPSTWLETSCMSAMEAMTGRCVMVAPLHGALSETMANYAISYSWTEDREEHKRRFRAGLIEAIESIGTHDMDAHLDEQKRYADKFYSWENRAGEWINYIDSLTKTRKFDFPGFNVPF